MRILTISSTIISLIISLITLVSAPAWSAEFSKKEKAALFGPKSQLVTTCQREVDARMKGLLTPEKFTPGMTQILKWTSGIVNGADLCTCVGERLSMTLTPDLLKKMTAEDGAARGKLAGQECVIAKMQSPTSGFCAALTDDIKALRAPDQVDESKMNEVCACVQDSFNKLSPSTFDQFFKTTASDYNEYTSGKSAETDTLKGNMMNCGIADLRK